MKSHLLILVVAAMLAGSATASSLRRGQVMQFGKNEPGGAKPRFKGVYNLSPKRCATGTMRVGCLDDYQDDQRRWYHDFVLKEDREPMTPDVCFQFCRNVSGSMYYGLSKGFKCYCTPFFRNDGRGDPTKCDVPCEGDPGNTCGGTTYVDVYEMHDCNNLAALPCKKPPQAIEHAVVFNSSIYRKTGTICSNGIRTPITTTASYCSVVCEPGYELLDNSIQCALKGNRLTYAWAEITGSAFCTPKNCGSPPRMTHATFSRADVYFPDSASYTCQTGYTLDGDAAGPTSHIINCTTEGNFTATRQCIKVRCGKCPLFNDSFVVKDNKTYQDVCPYKCAEGFSLDQRPTGQKAFETTCLPSGNFTEEQTCLRIQCGLPPAVSNSKFVDGPEAGKTIAVYEDSIHYECEKGFTKTGLFGGVTDFSVTCKADGTFTTPMMCKPVVCGAPARVKNSIFDPSKLVYMDTVTYTCELGYTMTGKAGDPVQDTVSCTAEGKFDKVVRCQPVSCGAPSVFPKSSLADADLKGETINFASEAVAYLCDEGYSTSSEDNPWKRSGSTFSVMCQADGTFSIPPKCKNIKDCLFRHCGDFGECVDLPDPSGVPLDDYTCKCNPGYEITLHDSKLRKNVKEKKCTNINDCPLKNTCGGKNSTGHRRGTCRDLILNYTCDCHTGYEIVPMKELAGNSTCAPKICGAVPEIEHAHLKEGDTNKIPKQANFETEPWEYMCDVGYTHNGEAPGPKTASMRCSFNGSFTEIPPCLPVTCGPPRLVEYAKLDTLTDELFFPDSISHTCQTGYSLTGKFGGATSFEVTCEANGTQTGLQMCKPVECGKPPSHANASYPETKVFHFGESVNVKCDEGFSLDRSVNPSSFQYELPCESNGEFGKQQECKKIQCVPAPTVVNAQKGKPDARYTESVEYETEVGFSVDGDASGETKFDIVCKSSSLYTEPSAILPISCGESPARDNAINSKDVHVYPEIAHYSCEIGFSVDGDAAAAKSFNLTCTPKGTYAGPSGCKPIECGEVMSPEHTKQVEDNEGAKLQTLHYGQHAAFTCLPGYAKDAKVNSTLTNLQVQCSPGGKLMYPPLCLNIDDCASPKNQCGPFKCVDNDEPTGVHVEDFHCDCPSGFKENVSSSGVHSCYNVQDCKPDDCQPGVCHDLINDFKCECPEGYKESSEGPMQHHCAPLPCGAAPSLLNAEPLETVEGVLVFGDVAMYSCAEGYSLDGSAQGEVMFEVSCLANQSFSKAPKCMPVACGVVPRVAHSTFPEGEERVFEETVTYECLKGYSTTGVHGGATKFTVSCQDDGTYSELKSCTGVKSPPVPEQVHVTVDPVGTVLSFPETLAVTCMDGYALLKKEHDMKDYVISAGAEGVLEYSFPSGSEGCTAIHCGEFPKVEHGTIEGSPLFGRLATVTCEKGFSVDQTAVPESASFEINCLATGKFSPAQECKPVLCGAAPKVNHSTSDADGAVVFDEEITYTFAMGYTLDGTAGGAKEFKVKCLATTDFSRLHVAKPVSCGPSPKRDFATHFARTYVFPETVPYTCLKGYSTDAKPEGPKEFSLTCAASGDYNGDDVCKPVECPSVPTPANSKPAGAAAATKLVFGQHANFKCLPGFTVGGLAHGPTEFSTSCQASGDMTPNEGCINVDDCIGNLCEPKGECVDLEKPTGRHIDDYECKCDSGFEQEINDEGKKYCNNVPDCPKGACEPGTCTDLVNDYKCNCPSGYFQGPNGAESLKHDCMPVSCGMPSTVKHAVTEVTSEVFFDSAPVSYKCETGYTLDASPEGGASFTLTCQANKNFTQPPKCLPVKCGTAPPVEEAFCPKEDGWVFPEKAPFVCNKGYSLDGTAAGQKASQGSCEASGEITGMQPCLPIACPEIPSQDNAFVFAEAPLVFPEMVEVACEHGFSLNEKDPSAVTYTIHCKDDGTYAIDYNVEASTGCVPVNCGDLPEVKNAKVSGGTHYGETATVSCSEGYSIDQSALPESATFEFSCLPEGRFSAQKQCKRIKCGVPPKVNHTTSPGSELEFEGTATYKLSEGYTLDGSANGSAEFMVTCQKDGLFSAGKVPQPIVCGDQPERDHATSSGGPFVYSQKAIYSCMPGYSTSGRANGPTNFELTCSSSGEFTGNDKCVPISCGTVSTPANSEKIPNTVGLKPGKLVYGELAAFKCKPGYSKDGVLHSALLEFNVSCLATGELHYPAGCLNNDDCQSPMNKCNSFGKCVDNAKPTGVHKDDFHCECDSGFAEEIEVIDGNTTRTCKNIMDCPPQACAPGSCQDLVNDFNCSCPSGYGYDEGTPQAATAKDCPPVSCGVPPAVDNAKTVSASSSQAVDYDMPPVSYRCEEGYTLNSDPQGETTFSLTCQANRSFSAPPLCLPVSCGPPVPVLNATIAYPKPAYVYEEKVVYKCDEGFSLDGSMAGAKKFRSKCRANGIFANVQECKPMKCPNVPKIPNATFVAANAAKLVYPEALNISCLPGHALTKDSHDEVSFKATCLANGQVKLSAEACVPIDCGAAPSVENADVSGSTLFGGILTVTGHAGYTLNGAPEGEKKFVIRCMESGDFSDVPVFQRCTCGSAPDVDNSGDIEHEPFERTSLLQVQEERLSHRNGRMLVHAVGSSIKSSLYSQSSALATAKFSGHRAAHAYRRHRELPLLKFQDGVKYTCKEGYRLKVGQKPVSVENPESFRVKCEASGNITPSDMPNEGEAMCQPVACPINKTKPEGPFVVFGEAHSFSCEPGHSLDGTPSGDTSYEETCQADGTLSSNHDCKPIDYCLESFCGDHGSCVNGKLGYTCSCKPGFKRSMMGLEGMDLSELDVFEGFETCVEIDECDTMSGEHLCGGSEGDAGSCVDKLEKYECECASGYDKHTSPKGLEACKPKECGTVPKHSHATCFKEGQKLVFKQRARFQCDPGHTLTGDSEGDSQYRIECEESGQYSETDECKPVDCGPVPSIKQATANATSLTFGQIAVFSCAKGHTTAGYASSPSNFSIECKASGLMTPPRECLPVTCGTSPRISDATAARSELVFGQGTDYKCKEGYTTTGLPGGKDAFRTECTANGTFTGTETCLPVSCGLPSEISNGQLEMQEYTFGQQIEVRCALGYTIDGLPDGSSTFAMICGKDGAYQGEKVCKPVSCGGAGDTAGSIGSKEETVYKQTATWTCKAGFSVNGQKKGPTTYKRKCLASGDFDKTGHIDCVDIDFCLTHPCTANGVCTDAGVGALAPPYTCDCQEGFEVKKRADGTETCAADDCKGNPCGKGGTCTDLSKVGGDPGQYSCQCEEGFTVDDSTDGKPTCQRVSCGALPPDVAHVVGTMEGTPEVFVAAKEGEDPEIDEFTNTPVLYAGDSAHYTCDEGFSTDGTLAPGSESFEVSCWNSGQLSKKREALNAMCVPVACDSYDLFAIPNAFIANEKDQYVYGDVVDVQCTEGHTLNGHKNGKTSMSFPCGVDGDFQNTRADLQCKPIKCRVPDKASTSRSPSKRKISFDESVQYTCEDGYTLGGKSGEDAITSFVGVCTASGEIEVVGGSDAQCKPISCGYIPHQENALVFHEGPLTFADDAVWAHCEEGTTVAGVADGADSYTIYCGMDGSIAMDGFGCEAPAFQIAGEVTDATSKWTKISGVTITAEKISFEGSDSRSIKATSNDRGKYEIVLPHGKWRLIGRKDGYITSSTDFDVTCNQIHTGAADLALSKELPSGTWRVMLQWGAHSEDLDSHSYIGTKDCINGDPDYDDCSVHVSWMNKDERDRKTGVRLILDRDDIDGFGPETTTFKNLEDCPSNDCVVHFWVHNYVPFDGPLGDSEAKVTVYKGSSSVATFEIPTSAGEEEWWPIFTIDGTSGVERVCGSNGGQCFSR